MSTRGAVRSRLAGVSARRWLIIGAVASLIIGGAAGGFLIHGTPSEAGTQAQSTNEVYGTFGTFGVVYGAKPKQLLTRLGAPDRKHNGCWIYSIRGGTFQGTKLLPQIAGMDAVRYCFSEGVVSVIEDHWRPGQQTNPLPQAWTPPTQFGCGTKRCHAKSP